MNNSDNGGGCLVAVLAFVVLFTILPLMILLAWNVGVVSIVSACGGSVGTLGWWEAIGASFAYIILRGIFNGGRKS